MKAKLSLHGELPTSEHLFYCVRWHDCAIRDLVGPCQWRRLLD
jgi:hypothetical protein